MYYREFGIPARIERAYSPEEIEELVEKYNGKKSCYTSVYCFDNMKDTDGKANYDSAVINGIWFDFDHNKDVSICLKDVRKFIRKYCKPNKITPRIYLTGGKGFQMNIDFHSLLDLSDEQKRQALREYLTHLKKKYRLKTLDQACINNSVACLRRIPNTKYVSKLTGEPTGVWCIPISVDEAMTMDIDEIYALATGPRDKLTPVKSGRAQRDMIDFLCDTAGIKHTISNSADYLIDQLKMSSVGSTKYMFNKDRLYKAPRECIIKLIEHNIAKGNSNYEENKAIVAELLNARWALTDISAVFRFIYNEPAGNHGWYNDDHTIPGKEIVKFDKNFGLRYRKETLKERNLCKDPNCPCI
jgi:hypothetical protein